MFFTYFKISLAIVVPLGCVLMGMPLQYRYIRGYYPQNQQQQKRRNMFGKAVQVKVYYQR